MVLLTAYWSSQLNASYIYIYMYIRHTLIAWAQFLWSRPQTTSHVILIRPGGNQRDCVRAEMEQGSRGTGPTRRRLSCEKARAKAEMEQEHDHARERKRKQRDPARVRQRRKSLTEEEAMYTGTV